MLIIDRECFINVLNSFNIWLNSGKKWTTMRNHPEMPFVSGKLFWIPSQGWRHISSHFYNFSIMF